MAAGPGVRHGLVRSSSQGMRFVGLMRFHESRAETTEAKVLSLFESNLVLVGGLVVVSWS